MKLGLALADVAVEIVGAVHLQRRNALGGVVRRVRLRTLTKAAQRQEYAKTEKALTQALIPFFEQQLESAARELTKLDTSKSFDDEAESFAKLIFDPSEWKAELIDRTLPVLVKAMLETAVETLETLGIPVRSKSKPPPATKSTASEWLESADQAMPLPEEFDLPDGDTFSMEFAVEYPDWMKREIAEQLKESYEGDWWDKVSDTTRSRLETVMRNGLREGHSISWMAASIRGLGSTFPVHRARNIARTETGNALNSARDVSIKGLKEELGPEGVKVGKSWLSVLGTTTRDTHADADGQLADEEGNFNVGGYMVPYPAHFSLPPSERCNCFPAGTLAQGNFTGAQKVWYDGTFTEIILRSGGRISLTPNHPVVTSEGLIPACQIKPGDKVLTYAAETDLSSLAASCGNQEQNEPVPIEEIFKAFFVASRVAFSDLVECRSVALDDFYGDGESCQGDIDIVGVDWSLLKDGKFNQFEKLGNSIFVLMPEELSLVSASGSHALGLNSVSAPSSSFPSCAEGFLDVFRRFEITPSGSLAVGHAADFDSNLKESSLQDTSSISGFLGDALQRHSRFVSFDDVVQTRDFDFAGYVYDLQSIYGLIVANDASYTSIGIVTSNCQCTVVSELEDGLTDDQLEALDMT
jgi:hypothetical protein